MAQELHDPGLLAGTCCHPGAEKVVEEVEVGQLCHPPALQ